MNPLAARIDAGQSPHEAPATHPAPGAGSRTLGQMVLDTSARHGGVALQYPCDGRTVYISYSELGTIATEIARGLIGLGVEPGDRVAILGITSAQWTLADCGAQCAGAVVAPIYHTNSPDECAYVLEHSEARVVFCGDPAQAAKIEQVRNRCPALEWIVLLDGQAAGALDLDELRRHGAKVPPDAVRGRLADISPDDVATLVYTSGTTGPPKGCMLSHENFLTTTRMYADQLAFNETRSLYQFLPLAHVLARIAQAVALSVGARLIYWGGDPARILDELQATGPTHFPAVPRIYEKLHGAALGKAADGPAVQRALFKWALACGAQARPALRDGRLPGLLTDLQYRLADKLVLSRVRALFGPRLELAMVGAAPVARELLEFFDACGVLVLEGYGLSESCAAATLNTVDALRFGSVGKPLPGVEIRIAEDGEVLMRGPHVFLGYYKAAEATAAALDRDGWLRTGDLGMLTDDGFLQITGRKKELIITSNGKNISPVNIESKLRESRYITEAVVFGDDRPYLVALLTLDREESAKLAARLGIANDPRTLAGDPRVHAEVEKNVDEVNAGLARIEQIKRFTILDRELSQAAGELTPTFKVKRSVVYDKHAELFARLYEQPQAS